jgi:NAD(P)-dependent dehydrogenase (short-subunit alcohol dehydrogenase family)
MEIAIVTGASKGLGRALAEGLVRSGWSLVIDARSEHALRAAETEIREHLEPGARLVAIAGDVTSGPHRSALVDAARQLGGLDLVVNNASSLGDTPLPGLVDYQLDGLRSVLEANVIAPIALFQDARDLLRHSSKPRLLNITSDASVEHYAGWGGYGMAKAALDHVTVTLGVEDSKLRSWAVDPGDLRTEMHQLAFPGEDISDRPLPESVVPNLLALIGSETPSGRYRASEFAISVGADR